MNEKRPRSTRQTRVARAKLALTRTPDIKMKKGLVEMSKVFIVFSLLITRKWPRANLMAVELSLISLH